MPPAYISWDTAPVRSERVKGFVCPCGDMDSARVAKEAQAATTLMPAKGVAVLARKHILLQRVAEELDAMGVPYLYVGQKAALTNSEEFRRFHAFLKLLANPFDNFAFLLIKDKLGLDDWDYAIVRRRAIETDKSHFQVWLDEYRDQDTGASTAPFDTKGLFMGWDGNSDVLGIALEIFQRIHNPLLALSDSGLAFIREWHNNADFGKTGIAAYLEWLSTYDVQDEIPDADPDGPGVVTLATIHGSKGLEWPYVILAGCNEGILPSKRAVDAGDIEEERRLAYVAITRARDALTLAVRPERSEKIGQDGKVRVYESPVSRFVGEAMGGVA